MNLFLTNNFAWQGDMGARGQPGLRVRRKLWPERDQETAQNRSKEPGFQDNQLKEPKYMKVNFNTGQDDLMAAFTCCTPVQANGHASYRCLS